MVTKQHCIMALAGLLMAIHDSYISYGNSTLLAERIMTQYTTG